PRPRAGAIGLPAPPPASMGTPARRGGGVDQLRRRPRRRPRGRRPTAAAGRGRDVPGREGRGAFLSPGGPGAVRRPRRTQRRRDRRSSLLASRDFLARREKSTALLTNEKQNLIAAARATVTAPLFPSRHRSGPCLPS